MTKRRSSSFPGLEQDPSEVITFRFSGSGLLTLPPDIVAVTMAAAQLTIGDPAADHVFIDNQGIQIKDGTTVRGNWQTDGDIFIGSDLSAPGSTYFSIFAQAQTYNSESMSAGDMLIGDNSASKANIFWDKSAGQLLFRGGTTTAVTLDTDSTLTAGGGVVTLDSNGISIQTEGSGGLAGKNAYSFENSTGTTIGGLYGADTSGPENRLFLELVEESIHDATITINARAPSTKDATITIRAYEGGGADDNWISILGGPNNTPGVYIQGSNEFVVNSPVAIMPRRTTTQRNALTGADGMILYNTTTDRMELWEGDGWGHHARSIYGEIYVNNNAAATTITTAGTAVQVTVFDTNGVSNETTPDHTSDDITILEDGDYLITCSVTISSVAGAAAKFDLEVMKNNGNARVAGIHAHRNLAGGGGDTGSVSLSGMAALVATDTIELWVTNDTNTQNIVIEDAILSLVKIS